MPGLVGLEDPWIRWDWVRDHTDVIRERLVAHVELTIITLAIGLVIALPLGVACYRSRRVYPAVLGVAGVIYTIPSLALFALLIPFTGLSRTTSIIPLVSYTLLILVRNVVAGLESVPDEVRESAKGMGFSSTRQLLRIELPLALPAIIAGIRITSVTIIGLVTITALIGEESLGLMILDGLYRDFRTPLVVGTALVVTLSAVADLGFLGMERVLTPWSRKSGRSWPSAMQFLTDVVDYLTTAANWWGVEGIVHRLQEHIVMSFVSLVVAMVITLPLGLVLGHTGRGGPLAINLSNLGRAVPSFAIIVITASIVGIGAKPAFIALVALAVPPMVTNTYTAVRGVDREVKEAAVGMGLTGRQVLWKVEIPMGLPLIMAGIRTSGVQVVATATLAALVGWGGLGRYIIDGLATREFDEVFVGAVLVALLSLLVELGLGAFQRLVVPTGLQDRLVATADLD